MNIKEYFEEYCSMKIDGHYAISEYYHSLSNYACYSIDKYKVNDDIQSADIYFTNIVISNVFGKKFYIDYSKNWGKQWNQMTNKKKKLTKTALVKMEKEISILMLQE